MEVISQYFAPGAEGGGGGRGKERGGRGKGGGGGRGWGGGRDKLFWLAWIRVQVPPSFWVFFFLFCHMAWKFWESNSCVWSFKCVFFFFLFGHTLACCPCSSIKGTARLLPRLLAATPFPRKETFQAGTWVFLRKPLQNNILPQLFSLTQWGAVKKIPFAVRQRASHLQRENKSTTTTNTHTHLLIQKGWILVPKITAWDEMDRGGQIMLL